MEALHLLFLTLAVVTIVLADKEGFAWMRGKKTLLDKNRLNKLHLMAWFSLGGLILTGVTMVYPYYKFYLTDTVFLVKMAFVGLLLANSFVIDRLMLVAINKPFSTLTTKEKIPLFLSGIISLIGWCGAATIGFFFL